MLPGYHYFYLMELNKPATSLLSSGAATNNNNVGPGGDLNSAPMEEKGFGGGAGGPQGRLGLESNANALTVHKRPPKEETV